PGRPQRGAGRSGAATSVPGRLVSVENSSVPLRLDVWLDVVCLCKTRTEAQQACRGGKVDVNGQVAKPHREVKPGDVVEISRKLGRRQRVIVKSTTERHVPKAEARTMYEDVTPPPSPEEQALLDLLRLAGPRRRPDPGAPDRRERRRLRQAKEGETPD
ncbi:MAG: RNA-binding S4 domain-containing protein, partial [Acidobacteriota bacterium]